MTWLAVDGEIVSVGGSYAPTQRDYDIIDASGCIVMPGLVQSHVHMCQTLARGRADGLELLDWLRQVIWPYEGAMSADDVASSARLAVRRTSPRWDNSGPGHGDGSSYR